MLSAQTQESCGAVYEQFMNIDPEQFMNNFMSNSSTPGSVSNVFSMWVSFCFNL